MSLLSRLLGKSPDSREAMRPLWHRTVEIAREPDFYARCGVADSVSGRFDAITLVLALVLLRMERGKDDAAGGALISASARLTELFVEDMDGQLRESGVGDLVVGKRMGKLVSVLGGRTGALREALASDDEALASALSRNVTLNPDAGPEDMARLCAHLRALHEKLQALPDDAILAARI